LAYQLTARDEAGAESVGGVRDGVDLVLGRRGLAVEQHHVPVRLGRHLRSQVNIIIISSSSSIIIVIITITIIIVIIIIVDPRERGRVSPRILALRT
jgi:hypothetical protein